MDTSHGFCILEEPCANKKNTNLGVNLYNQKNICIFFFSGTLNFLMYGLEVPHIIMPAFFGWQNLTQKLEVGP